MPQLEPVDYDPFSTVEDRRDQPYTLRQQWDDGQVGNQLRGGNNPANWPSIPEAPVSPLSRQLGHEDIRIDPSVPQRSPLQAGIDDVVDATNFVGSMAGRGRVIDPASAQIPDDPDLERIARFRDKAVKFVAVDHNPFPEGFGRGLKRWWYGDQPDPHQPGAPGPIPEASMTEDPISRRVGAAAEGFKDFVMRPGEVQAGRADPGDIGANLNMALNMTGGAGLIPKGANELRTGVGLRAKGDWFKKLPQFERLEKKGATPDTNYEITGIYRGGDDKLRAWVPDTDSGLRPYAAEMLKKAPEGASAPMHLIWDHPQLFEAYPWLKEAKVNILDNGGRGGGFYDPANGTINVYKGPTDRMEATVHHEAVHMIQHFEEFANGGAKEQFLSREFYEKKQELNKLKKAVEDKLITKVEVARLRKLKNEVDIMEDEAFQKYLQLHGESEARDAPFMKENPGKVPKHRVPQHVNPDLYPGQDVLVTKPFPRPKRGPVGFVEVEHDPWEGVGKN